MPKVDVFADDSCLKDVSLASISDNSLTISDFELRQPTSSSSPLWTLYQPPLPTDEPATTTTLQRTSAATTAAVTSDRTHLIRVPPGFEQRFDDAAPPPVALTTCPTVAISAGDSTGGSDKAIAVRVAHQVAEPQPQFMASAMQVIPLEVGKFCGDSQLDMNEMVRILRGAADCIDPTYIYGIDPFMRQFIWESLGTSVMNTFPDILFMRQQLFMHLIQLHLSTRSGNSDAGNGADDAQQQQGATATTTQDPAAAAVPPMPPVKSPIIDTGIDRTSMHKCRMVDPYLALIQLAIYSKPQPTPTNLYKAAEEFALFGTLHSSESTTATTTIADGKMVASVAEKSGPPLHYLDVHAKAQLQQQQQRRPQPYAVPFCMNYAGYQQHYQSSPSGHYSPFAKPVQASVLHVNRELFASHATAGMYTGGYAVDYSSFVPTHKSSPLGRTFGEARSIYQDASQQQQHQHNALTTARANLYQQFRMAKRNTMYATAQSPPQNSELNRAMQKAMQLHQQYQYQHQHYQQSQQPVQFERPVLEAVEYVDERVRTGVPNASKGAAVAEAASGEQKKTVVADVEMGDVHASEGTKD